MSFITDNILLWPVFHFTFFLGGGYTEALINLPERKRPFKMAKHLYCQNTDKIVNICIHEGIEMKDTLLDEYVALTSCLSIMHSRLCSFYSDEVQCVQPLGWGDTLTLSIYLLKAQTFH